MKVAQREVVENRALASYSTPRGKRRQHGNSKADQGKSKTLAKKDGTFVGTVKFLVSKNLANGSHYFVM